MADQRSTEPTPDAVTKKAFTPPKGRPTRPREGTNVQKRAFGPLAQWATVALLLLLVLVALILITDGGGFNPFGNDVNSLPGAPVAVAPR